MNALLGKIVSITPKENAPADNMEISFKPLCVLPTRMVIPEWLKDQTLKIEREVQDSREIGHPGDSIVLTPAESDKWLYPMQLTPDVVYGEVPKSIRIDLRWWKGDNAPDFTVRANGRQITGKFTKEEDSYWAEVDTAQFFSAVPRLPIEFEVNCDKLRLTCSVLPQNGPICSKLALKHGEIHRLENDWYSVDITSKTYWGAILGLTEKGRAVDHFRVPQDAILLHLECTGHTDRLIKWFGWWGKMDGVGMNSSGSRREADATTLGLSGVIDEGAGIRTSVSYTIHDDMPLITLKRDYYFSPKKEDDKNKPETPKELVDDLNSLGLAFRAGSIAEKNGHSGSRILCAKGDSLISMRSAQEGEHIQTRNWRLDQGWAIIEHPGRHECMMYLFDPMSLPTIMTWAGPYEITLEPKWLTMLLKPEDCIGYTLALTAGELCGADAEGGWIACRALTQDGGVCCGIIARTRNVDADAAAIIKMGTESIEMPLKNVLVPGIGAIQYAVADFPEARLTDEFDVTAAAIPSRRKV